MSGDEGQIFEPGFHIGSYRVERLLGKGGTGEVYLVTETSSQMPYALKVIDTARTGGGDELVQRFLREAEFATKVRHPNLVAVYASGVDSASGRCYMVMEYMPGGSLRDLIESDGIMSIPGVTTIATDIARALVLVEANGMVHRDVKPENILFAADGTAKLTDLGISRFESGPDLSVTRAGVVVGTPAYMAPEQMLDAHNVDIRADVYALGVVMFEMITGHRPNEGEGAMRTLAKALDGRAFPDVRTIRPDTPAPLALLVSEMTLPDAVERPVSARMVLELLSHPERVVAAAMPQPEVAEPDDFREPAGVRPPWYRDRGVLYAVTAMVLAFEALLVALVTVYTRS